MKDGASEAGTGKREDAPLQSGASSQGPAGAGGDQAAETTHAGAGDPAAPPTLYGRWAGKFPKDFDLDRALAEIRSGWKKKVEDAGT